MSRNIDPDFEDFLKETTTSTSLSQDEKVLGFVRKELDPVWQVVVTKLAFIQSTVGILTLFFCPQFEFSLTSNHDLFHFLHRNLGPTACMAVCGAIFMGTGACVSSILLRFSEIALILKSRLLLNFSLSGVALVFFLIAGADVYLSIAIPWILGAVLSSIVALDGIKYFRTLLLKL